MDEKIKGRKEGRNVENVKMKEGRRKRRAQGEITCLFRKTGEDNEGDTCERGRLW